jgi:hypothetical protein
VFYSISYIYAGRLHFEIEKSGFYKERAAKPDWSVAGHSCWGHGRDAFYQSIFAVKIHGKCT